MLAPAQSLDFLTLLDTARSNALAYLSSLLTEPEIQPAIARERRMAAAAILRIPIPEPAADPAAPPPSPSPPSPSPPSHTRGWPAESPTESPAAAPAASAPAQQRAAQAPRSADPSPTRQLAPPAPSGAPRELPAPVVAGAAAPGRCARTDAESVRLATAVLFPQRPRNGSKRRGSAADLIGRAGAPGPRVNTS